MNKKTVIIIIVGIILGLVIYGYLNAVPAPQDQANNNPQIEITPKLFDFGEINYGDIAEHIFKVKNLGDKTLEIKKVATSCACTTAKITKEKIAPQEEAELIVTYNTGLMSGAHAKGEQERIIYIKSNDPLNPQEEVRINAYVK